MSYLRPAAGYYLVGEKSVSLVETPGDESKNSSSINQFRIVLRLFYIEYRATHDDTQYINRVTHDNRHVDNIYYINRVTNDRQYI